MTTIAYHHDSRTICTDSLTSTSQTIVSWATRKCHRVDDGYVFASGNCAEIEHLLAHWHANQFDKITCTFFFVDDEGAVFFGEIRHGRRFLEPLSLNWAIGSGANWAIAAMDFGRSAFEAVEYACLRDKSSGGTVMTYRHDERSLWLHTPITSNSSLIVNSLAPGNNWR
ncbi:MULTISPECIES: proteasome subunit alpha [Pseudoalteromonas]|uniref:proteasome subunit alpha n=1 Tax=Pseudoalteromonas TaxID=53246 RepID=UPI000F7A6B48|nr:MULTISPECIES: proteasome subunit alpha [Pseudoalteromonas]MCG7560547.1 proteasome subunit alpha [Pseudoalteromonas sp. McH1-42]